MVYSLGWICRVVQRSRADPPLLWLFGSDPVDPHVSKVMSRNRAADTAPELRLRKALWNTGTRYSCHPANVPGRPDIVHRAARVAIFVDGCFWHGCPEHFKPPKTRTEFWQEKIRRNKAQRTKVVEELGPDWIVFEF